MTDHDPSMRTDPLSALIQRVRENVWPLLTGDETQVVRSAAVFCYDKKRVALGDAVNKAMDRLAHTEPLLPQLADAAERLQEEVEPAKALIARDSAFQEWAQCYLDSAKWAGHDRADAIKQELLTRDARVAELEGQIEKFREIIKPESGYLNRTFAVLFPAARPDTEK